MPSITRGARFLRAHSAASILSSRLRPRPNIRAATPFFFPTIPTSHLASRAHGTRRAHQWPAAAPATIQAAVTSVSAVVSSTAPEPAAVPAVVEPTATPANEYSAAADADAPAHIDTASVPSAPTEEATSAVALQSTAPVVIASDLMAPVVSAPVVLAPAVVSPIILDRVIQTPAVSMALAVLGLIDSAAPTLAVPVPSVTVPVNPVPVPPRARKTVRWADTTNPTSVLNPDKPVTRVRLFERILEIDRRKFWTDGRLEDRPVKTHISDGVQWLRGSDGIVYGKADWGTVAAGRSLIQFADDDSPAINQPWGNDPQVVHVQNFLRLQQGLTAVPSNPYAMAGALPPPAAAAAAAAPPPPNPYVMAGALPSPPTAGDALPPPPVPAPIAAPVASPYPGLPGSQRQWSFASVAIGEEESEDEPEDKQEEPPRQGLLYANEPNCFNDSDDEDNDEVNLDPALRSR